MAEETNTTVEESTEQTATEEKQHSPKYATLKERWEKDYITKGTLKGWVALNAKRKGKGITEEEYEEITGEKYEPEDFL